MTHLRNLSWQSMPDLNGVGAARSHRESDGQEKPIACASRLLGVAEKKYSQLENEGLKIVFAMKRFNLLFG